MRYVVVGSAGKTDRIVILCPRCKTICDLSLLENGRLVYECGTLDCDFQKTFLRAEALEGVEQ